MALDKTLRIGVFSLFAYWGQSLSSTSSNSQVFWSGQVKGQARLVEPLPTALHQLFPGEFPSLSAARKACRRRLIFVEGALGSCQTVVYENDALEKRERGASGEFEVNERLVGLLPVVFEDDHMAVVVKPAGMPTHGATSSELNSGTKKRRGSSSSSSRATTTVRTALLHVLKPSKATATLTTSETKEEQQQQQQHIRAVNISSGVKGFFAPLRRPTHVHRLDKVNDTLPSTPLIKSSHK
jgi:23S rRNA-/tRNA-specific pseudouridylate synthase